MSSSLGKTTDWKSKRAQSKQAYQTNQAEWIRDKSVEPTQAKMDFRRKRKKKRHEDKKIKWWRWREKKANLYRGVKVKRKENELGKRQWGEGEKKGQHRKVRGKIKWQMERRDQRKGRKEGEDRWKNDTSRVGTLLECSALQNQNSMSGWVKG